MDTVALIPARSGSKGVPDKNMRLLGGHTLLDWSISACLKAKLVDQVYVSTDSTSYANHAKELGAKVPFIRPTAISGDHSTDYEFVKHALEWLKENDGTPRIIVHIRPTTPLRDPSVIDRAIRMFDEDAGQATSMRSVHKMSESAYKTFEIAPMGVLRPLGKEIMDIDGENNARQAFPETYSANGYVDILSTKFIEKNKKIHGSHVLPFITSETHEVDTLDDLNYLEFQLEKNPQIFEVIFGDN